jgi:hypothetical protein
MWSKKGTDVSMLLEPVPSRLRESSMLDSLVVLEILAVRGAEVMIQV